MHKYHPELTNVNLFALFFSGSDSGTVFSGRTMALLFLPRIHYDIAAATYKSGDPDCAGIAYFHIQKKKGRADTVPFGIADVYCEMTMPKFILVCEISTPDLFRNGKIAGEILFDATANHHDRMVFLSIHYPDFLSLNDKNFLTDDSKRFNLDHVEMDAMQLFHIIVM